MRKLHNRLGGGGIRSRLVAVMAALAMLLASVVTGTALAADGASDGETSGSSVTAEAATGGSDASDESASSTTTDANAEPTVVQADDGSATYTATVPMADDGESGDGVVVTATVPAGAFSTDVTLNASLVTGDDAAAVADQLDGADVDYDGFVALDVHFADADGNEVEPAQAVDVSFQAPQSALGDDVDASSISVQHFVEDGDGDVSKVETVADAGDETDGTVTVDGVASLSADETADAAAVNSGATVAAEFTVDTFSTFLITWSQDRTTYFDVTVYYVDENGDGIQGSRSDDTISSGKTVNINADYAGAIEGYTYQDAHYGSYDGDLVTRMDASQSGSGPNTTRYLRFYNGGNQQPVAELTYGKYTQQRQTADVYLVYEPVPLGDFYIADTVRADGRFTATFADGKAPQLDDGQYIQYTWKRGLDQNNIATPVEYTKVTGSSYNMESSNSQWVNVALDEKVANASGADRYWYQVTAQVMNADGTPDEGEGKEYTAQLQVPYYIELQNGSFENPNITGYMNSGGFNYQFANDQSPEMIWHTTGLGSATGKNGQDIEIVRTETYGQQQQAKAKYNCSYADDGVQYAELNAEAYGALYQEVMTVPGSTLNWSFAHLPRNVVQQNYGRQTGDTMALVIMPSSVAPKYIERLTDASTNPNAIRSILAEIESLGEENGYFVQEETSNYQYSQDGRQSGEHGPNSWNTYDGTYTVGDDQYLTTFFFVAVDTASNNHNPAVGNLLDDVWFTTDLIPTTPDTAILTITKKVDGLDLTENQDYSVTITVKDGNQELVKYGFAASNFDSNGKAELTLRVNIPTNGNRELTVTETATTVDGYELTQTVQVGDSSPVLGSSTSVIVSGNQNFSVLFTNSYKENDPTPVTIPGLVETKTVEGNTAQAKAFTFIVDPGDLAAAGKAGFDDSEHSSIDEQHNCAYMGGRYSCVNIAMNDGETQTVHASNGMTLTADDDGKTYTYTYTESAPDGWRGDVDQWIVTVSADKSESENAMQATVSVYKGDSTDSEHLYAQYVYTGSEELVGDPGKGQAFPNSGADVPAVPTVAFTNTFVAVSSLPLTGGDATARNILLAGGGVLLLAGAAWLLARRRRV